MINLLKFHKPKSRFSSLRHRSRESYQAATECGAAAPKIILTRQIAFVYWAQKLQGFFLGDDCTQGSAFGVTLANILRR
jgi:hypothetical protein